jgi:hypothetical protein
MEPVHGSCKSPCLSGRTVERARSMPPEQALVCPVSTSTSFANNRRMVIGSRYQSTCGQHRPSKRSGACSRQLILSRFGCRPRNLEPNWRLQSQTPGTGHRISSNSRSEIELASSFPTTATISSARSRVTILNYSRRRARTSPGCVAERTSDRIGPARKSLMNAFWRQRGRSQNR